MKRTYHIGENKERMSLFIFIVICVFLTLLATYPSVNTFASSADEITPVTDPSWSAPTEVTDSSEANDTEPITETTAPIPDVTESETIPGLTEIPFFDVGTVHAVEYVQSENIMPYALYSPSSAAKYDKLPLIVWLHGSGEKSVDVDTFLSNGLPAVLNDWNLQGFNAYVLCPHLTGSWNAGAWCLPQSKDALSDLLDLIVTQYNIDEDKVIITGHSLGGQGALYMAARMPGRFSAVVVLSGYNPISRYDKTVDISTIMAPVCGFVGTVSAGEDDVSYRFMLNGFANRFGVDNTYVINCSHGKVPQKAFCQDNNGNGMSDLLEWIHEKAIK